MENFTIINLQALTGSVAIYLCFRYWIQPKILGSVALTVSELLKIQLHPFSKYNR